MSKYKQCPKGHFYQGDVCPYCPTQYYSVNEVDPFNGAGNLQQHIEELMTIPVCPHCGRPIRKGIPHPDNGIAVSSLYDIRDRIVPWNYQWNGVCENCGHDFNISMRIDMGSSGPDNKIRETKIRVGARGFLHHITCDYGDWRSTVLSGIEIETKCGLGHETEKFFLSANELKYLIEVLQNSPILKQFDYYEEDVKKNMVHT